MRVINYYDRINKQMIELEVTDEVARFLLANDKKLRRKQNKFNYYTIPLDTVVYSGENEDITLQEVIAEPKDDEVMDCRQCKKKLEFFNIVWKVVDNLDKEKYDLGFVCEEKISKRNCKRKRN